MPRSADPSTSKRGERVDPLRGRVIFCAASFVVLFALISGRMAEIALFDSTGKSVAFAEPLEPVGRPDIVDRNGAILATDLAVASIYADPRDVWDPADTARRLATVFPDIDVEDLTQKLSAKTAFVWVKRDITPRQHAAVHDLGLPGIDFRQELKRVYPNGHLASHVVGFVDVDGHGLAGIERAIDTTLADKVAQGQPITLSIDMRVQHVIEDELAQTIQKFSAIGGIGLVMDVHTGEIIAMASAPDFDPNHVTDDSPDNRFNRATLGVYEMGSTFKSFNTAMALDNGISPKAQFETTSNIHIGRFTIHDFHPAKHNLSVEEIFEESSNIGSAKMAMSLGIEKQKAFLASLGQLGPMPLELPERGAPLWPQHNWGQVELMTIAFGHGIAVSPVHVVTGISALVNGGILITPTILKRTTMDGVAQTRVIKPETSAEMGRMFRLVVEHGTGRNADVPGYPVGGKTGTADKAKNGGYAHKALLSSFIGEFPADKPQYTVLVIVDEPHGIKETGGFATGGYTAAPAVSRIVGRIAPMLGIEPRLDTNGQPETAKADANLVADDH